jgi:DNA-binding transcriptional MerR regulator
MKNTPFILAAIAIVSGTMLTSCDMLDKRGDTSQTMVTEAREDVVEANQALKVAIEQFKKESVEAITANEKSIAAFKVKIADQNAENKAISEKKLAELEQKNKELKKKLADYKEDGNEQWKSFKTEFNHDMNELGKAFSDLTVNNVN